MVCFWPLLFQVSHKLLLRAMASLKAGVKAGTSEFEASGKQSAEGMVRALNELASFCDRELRLTEDEGQICSRAS